MKPHLVEFVGGPLDGYQHPISYSPQLLSTILDLPVSPDFLWILNGEGDRPLGMATSVAVYELEGEQQTVHYHYVCSIAAGERQLEEA